MADDTEAKLRKLIGDVFEERSAAREKAEKEKNDPEFRLLNKISESVSNSIRDTLKEFLGGDDERQKEEPKGGTIAELFGLGKSDGK